MADKKEALAELKKRAASRTMKENSKPKSTKNISGWMVKVGTKKQTRLYFEFHYSSKELRFFKSQNDTKPKGVFDLSKGATIRHITLSKNPLAPAWSLRMPDKVHLFISEHEQERDLWFVKIKAIKEISVLDNVMDHMELQEAEIDRKGKNRKKLGSQHFFERATFKSSRNCKACNKELSKHGYYCLNCKSAVHKQCQSKLIGVCESPDKLEDGGPLTPTLRSQTEPSLIASLFPDESPRNEAQIPQIQALIKEMDQYMDQLLAAVSDAKDDIMASLSRAPTDDLVTRTEHNILRMREVHQTLKPFDYTKREDTFSEAYKQVGDNRGKLEAMVSSIAPVAENAVTVLGNIARALHSFAGSKSLRFAEKLKEVLQEINKIEFKKENETQSSTQRSLVTDISDENWVRASARTTVEDLRQAIERIFFKVASYRSGLLDVLSDFNASPATVTRIETIHTDLSRMLKVLEPHLEARLKATLKMVEVVQAPTDDSKKKVQKFATASGLAVSHVSRTLISIKTSSVCGFSHSLKDVVEQLKKILGLNLTKPKIHTDEEEYEEEVDEEKEEAVAQKKAKGSFTENYEVIRTVGSGFFGVVKEVKHRVTNETRAVKILDTNEETAEREKIIKNELSVLVGLSHPHITTLHEFYVADNQHLLILDLASGGELSDKIMELGKIKEPDARRMIEQILQGLNYLHQQSIVHRDVKPENILLSSKDPEARVMICDLGSASFLWTDEEGEETPLTDPLPGSLMYAAPEAIKNGTTGYSKPVDIWSLGCVLYTMLSGVPPFLADDDSVLKDKIIKGVGPLSSSEWDMVPQAAKNFVLKALTYDPSTRVTAPQALQHPWIR